jgi:hypothetical protein
MKPELIFQHLIDVAEKLDIKVLEQSFRSTGITAKSSMCKIKGKRFFILDKHLPLAKKIDALTTGLKEMDTEDIYIVPAIRRLLR